MKFYLSTSNENLKLEFLRYKKSNIIEEKELKSHNIKEVILISIDKPRLIDLTKPFYKRYFFYSSELPISSLTFSYNPSLKNDSNSFLASSAFFLLSSSLIS